MLYAKSGAIALNLATGLQSVTGLGFQPKLLLFMTTPDTGNSPPLAAPSNVHWSLGATDGITSVVEASNAREVNPSDAIKYADTTHIMMVGNPAGSMTVDYSATLNSIDADGFTINIDDAPASAYRFGYLALGGNDLDDVKIGRFATNGAVGLQSITGVGFQPDVVIFFFSKTTAAPPTTEADASMAMGFANGLGVNDQYAQHAGYQDNVGGLSGGATHWHEAGYVISLYNFAGALTHRAIMSSFDADGFTLNWTQHLAPTFNVSYIAIKGGATFASKVGTRQLSSVTGSTTVVNTVGFQPSVGLFPSAAWPLASFHFSGLFSHGWADGALNQFMTAGTGQIFAGAWKDKRSVADNRMYRKIDYTTAQEMESASFQSWDPTGFTLYMNKGQSPSAGSYIGYLVMAGNTPETNQIIGQAGMVA